MDNIQDLLRCQEQLAGKPTAGTLTAQLKLEEGVYHLHFKDDGAGANAEKIAEKVKSKGLPVPTDASAILDFFTW